jgi:hypothetical protein
VVITFYLCLLVISVLLLLVALIKCLHLVLTLSLIAAIIYCVMLVTAKKFALNNTYHQHKIHRMNRTILGLAALAVLTGTLLVYPRHFTFHTLWIQTGYVLVGLFISMVALLIWVAKKKYTLAPHTWLMMYLFLALLLVIAIHDAVTKTSLVS